MEQSKTKRKLPPFLILGIIALVAALALALTNSVTEGPIRAYQQKQLSESFSAVLPASSYEELTVPQGFDNVSSLAKAMDGETLAGYCVKASVQGYGGPVAVVLGVNPSGRVVGSVIGDSDFAETDGFGARWKQEANVQKLLGLDAVQGGAFEALSGATRTSNAVLAATNSALACVANVMGQEQTGSVVFGKPVALESAANETAALTPGATLAGEAEGFGGEPVKVTVKLDDDTRIASLKVDASTQTPGIGQNCEGADFTDQFVGKAIPVTLSEGVDALSGATMTSTAVVNAINAAVPENPWKAGAALVGKAVGFGDGEVVVNLSLDDEGKISKLKVNASSQTPGIGQNCEGAEFTDQFIGKAAPLTLGEDVDALTGATVTSTAVVDAINGAYAVEAEAAVAESVTELAADATASLGVTDSGIARLTAAENYNGEITVNYQVENGKVVSAELNTPSAKTDASASANAQNDADNGSLTISVEGFENKPVSVSVSLDAEGKIANLTVDASTQTPGLGQRCAESAFTSQFVGKTAPLAIGTDIDAVTGATITSNAVVEAVNQLLASSFEGNAETAKTVPVENAKLPEFVVPEGAITLTEQGYGDHPITVALTKDEDGAITSLAVDVSSQTPGLGQRCAEESFTSQFIGKKAPLTLGVDIDEVSGATITSIAVVEAVNELLIKGPRPVEEETAAIAPAPAAEAENKAAGAEGLSLTKAGYEDKPITVTLTANEDGSIASLTVDASTQTPGLGQRCAEESFTSQFIGKKAPLVLGTDIDAVTSASVTSAAVVEAVNELLASDSEGAANAPKAAEEEVIPELPPFVVPEGAMTLTDQGYGDHPITVALTTDENGAIASLAVDVSSQTPGLGQRCAEESFTSQFIGKKAPLTLGVDIDEVSGATITSMAIVEAVNELLIKGPRPVEEEAAEIAPAPAAAEENEAAGAEGLSLTKAGYEDKPITVTLTTNDDGSIASMTVDASTQTPGLGQRCAEESFTSQFIGKKAPLVLGTDIDAITSASVTSAAVVDAVNELLASAASEGAAETLEVAAEEPVAELPPFVVPEDAVTITVQGYGDKPITIALTKDEDGAITAFAVDVSSQTPGLGQRCAEEIFTSQFIGKKAPLTLGVDIDEVSGATITSMAIVEAVNRLLTLDK